MSSCTTAHALRVSTWWQDRLAHSGNQPRKISSTYTMILRRKSTFIDTMKSQLSYTRELNEDQDIPFFNVRWLNIVDDTSPSNILSTNIRATYFLYNRIGKMMTRNLGTPRFLGSLIRVLQWHRHFASCTVIILISTLLLNKIYFT